MSREKKSIGDLADSVLNEVVREQLVKNAALAHTSSVSVKTELGQLLVKVAGRIREEVGNNEISYADLANFRKTYDL